MDASPAMANKKFGIHAAAKGGRVPESPKPVLTRNITRYRIVDAREMPIPTDAPPRPAEVASGTPKRMTTSGKVRLRGVNRHSFWPTSGRTTSEALSLLDANLIKDMNMNAVRTSHYPPDAHFLEACDALDQRGGRRAAGTYSTSVSSDENRFQRDLHLAAAGAGALDINLLRWRGRVIAYAYNY